MTAAETDQAFEVLAENWEIVETFILSDTQWRFGPTGQPLGLDYAGVRAVLAFLRRAPSPDLLHGLRIMEQTVLAEMARRRA